MNSHPPALEFAFEIQANIGAPLRAGRGRLGERQHIVITGGTVTGPLLNGVVLPGGSDWALLRDDGSTIVDAHYTVQAEDGSLIYVHNRGLRVSSEEVLQRLRSGAPVAAHEVYFRSTPVFDAPDGPHAWLSDHVFVAVLGRQGSGVLIQVFVVR